MKIEVKTITPEKAFELLKKNVKNRKLKKNIVLDYADQMERGQWKLTSQGITISKDGEIIDGQHRLAAIVKSNKTIDIVVSNGLEYEEVFKVYDTGTRRTASDSLYISGVKNSTYIAALIKKKMQLDRVNKTTNAGAGVVKITNTDISEAYYKNELAYQEVCKLGVRCHVKLKVLSPAYIMGIAAHLILTKKHNIEIVTSFFEQLFYNENVENETINVLRNKLINNAIDNKKMTELVKTINLIKTWNCYITGKELKCLKADINNDKQIEFK